MTVRILFVCYENICRSPMAEGAFNRLLELRGVAGHFEAESAGTVGYQSGSFPDPRAVRAAARAGIDISANRARCIDELDLSTFDHLFVMDHENHRDVAVVLDGYGLPPARLVTDYAGTAAGFGIPDPYYGPETGFDSTLDSLAVCVRGILDHLMAEYGIGMRDGGMGFEPGLQGA